jgi:hypothetical protein
MPLKEKHFPEEEKFSGLDFKGVSEQNSGTSQGAESGGSCNRAIRNSAGTFLAAVRNA